MAREKDTYLNREGLEYYHRKIKGEFATKTELEQGLSEKQDVLTSDNAGNGIAITTDQSGNVVISSTQNSAEWGNITGDITDQTDLVDYISDNGGKIDSISVNGSPQTIVNKNVDITVPTATSDLNNDSGFITNTVNNLVNYYLKSETYTQEEVNSLIGAISTIDIRVVEELPTTDISTTTIYLVPIETSEENNVYEEYIYVNNSWELIGTTQVDLSDYYTKTQVDGLLDDKVDKIAGKGLSTEDFTAAEKSKLAGIESGAEVNVNADWNAVSGDAEILNKPVLASVALSGSYNDLANKPTIPTITIVDWTVS